MFELARTSARFRNQNHIFEPDSAEPGIVQARLNREYLPIFQNYFLQTRMLMNFQSKPVTGPVKESHSSSFADLSWEAAAGKKFLDSFVNRHSTDASFDAP